MDYVQLLYLPITEIGGTFLHVLCCESNTTLLLDLFISTCDLVYLYEIQRLVMKLNSIFTEIKDMVIYQVSFVRLLSVYLNFWSIRNDQCLYLDD